MPAPAVCQRMEDLWHQWLSGHIPLQYESNRCTMSSWQQTINITVNQTKYQQNHQKLFIRYAVLKYFQTLKKIIFLKINNFLKYFSLIDKEKKLLWCPQWQKLQQIPECQMKNNHMQTSQEPCNYCAQHYRNLNCFSGLKTLKKKKHQLTNHESRLIRNVGRVMALQNKMIALKEHPKVHISRNMEVISRSHYTNLKSYHKMQIVRSSYVHKG